MNPVRVKCQQPIEQVEITTEYGVAVFDAHLVLVPGFARKVAKNLTTYDAGTSTVTCPIPADLFEGLPSGPYAVGIRPINEGGPSSWATSPVMNIVGEPLAVTNVIVE